MNNKYLILDFGGVIAYPPSGYWDITPKFEGLIDINKIDKVKYKEVREKYKNILSEKVTTLDEEYNMFTRFYDGVLKEVIPNYSYDMAKEIAYDRTYNLNKYKLFDNVKDELDYLSNKYTLILLTDNWPCVIDYLKYNNLYDYFKKIYVSSFYGVEKKDKVFFDFPIKEFNIESAIFIDDNDANLDIAKEKGLYVYHMDRNNKYITSKYKIINNLFEL